MCCYNSYLNDLGYANPLVYNPYNNAASLIGTANGCNNIAALPGTANGCNGISPYNSYAQGFTDGYYAGRSARRCCNRGFY